MMNETTESMSDDTPWWPEPANMLGGLGPQPGGGARR